MKTTTEKDKITGVGITNKYISREYIYRVENCSRVKWFKTEQAAIRYAKRFGRLVESRPLNN